MPNAQILSRITLERPTHQHRYFLHLVVILFFIWSLYRILFVGIPVVIDETIAKIIFFALPAALYIVLTQAPLLYDELHSRKLFPGIFLGLAFGGLFGFVGTFATLSSKSHVLIAPLFISPIFWWQFFLALLTGFWESVFFFGWIFATIEQAFPRWSLLKISMVNTCIFVLFHIPNMLIQFNVHWGVSFPYFFISQVFLLSSFAVGQGLLFYRYRNIYLITMTHAIWGMVLLVFGK